MNVIVWLFAVSILLLAGCGSSASVTAISNPPIPSTAQAASGPATLRMDFSSRAPCYAWWPRRSTRADSRSRP